jgi:hypothetical protein
MTARVNRHAVLVLTWLVVTTTATAVAWWAVTFVTTEVADRGPLRPSDVVAASVRQVVPVPSWFAGGQPVAGPPPSVSDSSTDLANAVAGVPADTTAVHSSGTSRVAAPPPAPPSPAAPVAGPRLVARWTPTAGSSHVAAAAVTDPVTASTVALNAPAPASPAPAIPPVAGTSSPEFALIRRTGFTTTTTVTPPSSSTPAFTVAPPSPSARAVRHRAMTASTIGQATAAVTLRRHLRDPAQAATCPQPASPGDLGSESTS